MGERWLRAVEAYDGGEEDCSCEDCIASIINGLPAPHLGHDGWEPGPGGGAPGDLTEIVLIDGHLVDVRRRAVQGSGYECAAYELEGRGLLRGPRVVERPVPVREEPHEAMLDWLGRVVGGADALASLDTTPLPTDEDLDLGAVPGHLRERVQIIDEHVQAAYGHLLLGPELLTASRRLLVRAAGAKVLDAWREVEDSWVAAAVLHCVIKANALAGTGRGFAVKTLLEGVADRAVPTDRSGRLAELVGGPQWPHGRTPAEAPSVYVLGDASLLLSSFRRSLVVYRDLAGRLETDAAKG